MGGRQSTSDSLRSCLGQGVPEIEELKLGEEIGRGQWGVVYAGADAEGCEDYAVKALNGDRVQPNKIRRENTLFWKLQHPCVAKFHGCYFKDASIFIVMDLYVGGTLDEACQRYRESLACRRAKCPCINISSVRAFVTRMLQATAWMHLHGIAHRDLKLLNFLVDRMDVNHPDCKAYLCDFGCACRLAQGQRLKDPQGTALFWAPECFRKDYGLAVDIWAIGESTSRMLLDRAKDLSAAKQANKTPLVSDYCDRCMSESMVKMLQSFHSGLLQQDEALRLTAADALEHDFVTSAGLAMVQLDTVNSKVQRRLDHTVGHCRDTVALDRAEAAARSRGISGSSLNSSFTGDATLALGASAAISASVTSVML